MSGLGVVRRGPSDRRNHSGRRSRPTAQSHVAQILGAADDKGSVEKAERWGGGLRKLAYRVQKYQEGLYILIQFTSPPELVKEIERRLHVSDMVIKFITVRVDERLKKVEKRKKARAKRAARRPQPVAAPAAPAPPEPGPAPGLPGMPAEPAEAKVEPVAHE